MEQDAQSAAPAAGGPAPYIDRDLSDLAYVRRILEQAQSATAPLAERLRFLGISSAVLDEFVAVRYDKVASDIRSAVEAGTQRLRVEQFDALTELLALVAPYDLHIEPARFGKQDAATPELARKFSEEVMPALTPLTVDREHPFPFLRSQQLSLVLSANSAGNAQQMVVIPIPLSLGGLLATANPNANPNGSYIRTEALTAACVEQLLPNATIHDVAVFRIIRANDIQMAPSFNDLRTEVERGLDSRAQNPVVCIEINDTASVQLQDFLSAHLFAGRRGFVCRCPHPGVAPFAELQSRAETQFLAAGTRDAFYPTSVPHRFRHLEEFHGDWFAAMRNGDILLHWPYDDFAAQIELLQQAATDPDVVAIKQTLYRTDDDVIRPLTVAARNGKEVTVVLELEARENEQQNVAISRDLEAAGARVIYGIIDLKIHAKLLLVVRKDHDGLREYANFATGNYHTSNARHYSDLSLFTAHRQLGRDLTRLFNYITGNLNSADTKDLVVAPATMRAHLLQCIEREADNARHGGPSGIWIKLNSLLDRKIIDALNNAAQAGVPIKAVVRRHCALRPGVAGLSPGIEIKSLIGRYLEHARVVCFANGAALPGPAANVYIGSADWMPRNFDERVEVLVPILDEGLRMLLLGEFFSANFRDTEQSWVLQSDGHYSRSEATGFCAQSHFAQTPLAP